MKKFLPLFILILISGFAVWSQTVVKQLYFSSPNQSLDRVDPVATADATTAQSSVLYGGTSYETITQLGTAAFSNAAQTASTHSFSYFSTISSSTSRILMVGISYKNTNDRTVTSVTYAGQTMTLVGDRSYTPSGSNYYARVYIYRLLAPATGNNTLSITWSGALSQGAVIGAVTYSGVDQTTPTGTFASATGSNSVPAVTVSGATGRMMFGVVAGLTTSNYAASTGGTQLYTSTPYSGQTAGSGQSKAGAATVSLSWNGSNDKWAVAGVSLIQARQPSNTIFTQSTTLCSNLIIKAGTISVTNYISIVSGTMIINPAVTATIKYGSTTIITLSNPSYNLVTGLLTWTGSLAADVTVPAGQAITLEVTNNQSGVNFLIEYDSQTKPSKIEIPVSTFINVNSIGVYNAAYSAGNAITTSPVGVSRYFRAVVSDPFGTSDITGLDFTITPTGTVVAGTLVATSGCTKTFEYAWTTPFISGSYTINATAKEGYENTVTHSLNISHYVCSVCPPVAENDSITGSGGSPVTIDVLVNDYGINAGINSSSLNILMQPNNGSAYILDGKVVYLPNGSYAGKDTIIYQVCDLSSPTPLCTTAKVFITTDPLIIDICGNTPKPHVYYIPYPEQDAYQALKASTSSTMPTNNIRTVISIKLPYQGMTIVWDEWEDGYEANYLNPTQSTTKVWGDGNIYNGIAPGYPTDIIPAGGNIVLDNTMPANPRNSASFFYDGKDKVTSSGEVALTQVSGEPTNIAVQVIKTNITSTFDFGQSFTVPFGQNFNSQDFKYTSLFIRASQNNTTINIDKDNNGTFETTTTLNEGGCYFVNGGVMTGATVTSDKPVGIEVSAGGIDQYSIRNSPIFPATWYSNIYYTPVPTSDAAASSPKDTSVVMLYNSLNRNITINWYSGAPASGTILIPAKSTVRFPLAYSTTAAYKFINLTGESFTAIEIIDSYTLGGGGNNGQEYDWAFNLISEPRLTDFATIAWAPGSLDGSRNDNPIWVTPTSNTTVYVKYNGDISTGPNTSPCGLKYDVAITLNALNYVKIKDPNDNDQSGIAIYTCDGAKIAAVYGEDATTAVAGSPSWDVGATIQPFCKQKLVFARDDYSRTLVNQPVTITVLKNDGGFLAVINPASLNTLGLLQPKHGTISINTDGTILYTPTASYIGVDTFEYSICSTAPEVCAKAKVIVTISGCPGDNNQNVISGQVFMDRNKDGIKNDDGKGYPNIKVYLYTDGNCNSTIDANEKTDSVTVDSSGFYQFVKYPEKIIADNFDGTGGASSCDNGTDGNTPWTTSWTDAGDLSTNFCNNSQTAANTDVEIVNNTGFNYGLRLKDKNVSARRMINLSGVTKAFLSFSYMKKSTSLTSVDTVFVQASVNGSAFTTIYTIKGDGTADNAYVPIYNQDITNFISATTYIRFLTNNNMTDNDSIYIDDVSINYLNYPQCYITGIAAASVPADAISTSVQQKSMSFNIGSSCSSSSDFGIAKKSVIISGTIYDDGNGLNDAVINGTAMGTLDGSTLYGYLTDMDGKILLKTTINSNGTYSFPTADVNTNYKLFVSTSNLNAYDPTPASRVMPSLWSNTGDAFGVNNNSGTGNEAGLPDMSINITTALVNVSNVNFGIERLPDSDDYSTNVGQPVVNQFITLNGGSNPPVLSGTDLEDCNSGSVLTSRSVTIDVLPINSELYYNGILVTAGQTISNFNPSLFKIKYTTATLGSLNTSFQYSFVDAAGKKDPYPATYTLNWLIPLPVADLILDADLTGTNTLLNWKTSSEYNTAYYEIERSTDNISFIKTGSKVFAAGMSAISKRYQLIDNVTDLQSAGIIYYRVKLYDTDGKVTYSNIAAVRLSVNNTTIKTWPNPFVSKLQIQINSQVNTAVELRITDVAGKMIITQSKQVMKGNNQLSIENLDKLPSGTYLLQVINAMDLTNTIFKLTKQ